MAAMTRQETMAFALVNLKPRCGTSRQGAKTGTADKKCLTPPPPGFSYPLLARP